MFIQPVLRLGALNVLIYSRSLFSIAIQTFSSSYQNAYTINSN